MNLIEWVILIFLVSNNAYCIISKDVSTHCLGGWMFSLLFFITLIKNPKV